MTRVKVCGVAELDDARLAVELGAWAVGMVFHAESPRACDPGTAELIGAELKRKAEIVGVFVNWPLDELEHMADRASLSILQLHGDEGPAYCREAARRTGCRVMKAMQAKDAAAVRKLESYREVHLHMLDAHSDSLRGGTGSTFEWELAAHHHGSVPLVLSGGLSPDNVRQAIDAVRPYAVDSASGTEAEPGRKDPAKLRALFRAVERADAERAA
jgi:phosphoribosylanthranilate isomerase